MNLHESHSDDPPEQDGQAPSDPDTKGADEPGSGLSASSRIFLVGFGLSFLLLVAEYLTSGGFPGWFVLVPTNPTTLLAALVGHQVETLVGSRWADEAFFGTIVLESALWWLILSIFVVEVRRRRSARLLAPR